MRESIGKDKLKKLIVFNTERNKKLIERMISDEASLTGQTGSSLIENHILNDLLPANRNGRHYVECLYLSGWSVRKVAGAIFGNSAGGINWKSRFDNLYPLVRFCHNKSMLSESRITGNEGELYHFRSQLDSISRVLENCADEQSTDVNESIIADDSVSADDTSTCQMPDTQIETAKESISREKVSDYLRREADHARTLLKIATDFPSQINLDSIYRLLLDNWAYLKDSTFTYRLLTDVMDMEKNWTETPETRYEFVRIIKELSEEW